MLTLSLLHRYRVKFFDLREPDPITMQWISESKAKSSNMALQIWHIVAKLFLKIFLTQTCSNGLLRRGSMFILSENVSAELFTAMNIRAELIFVIAAIFPVPCEWRTKLWKRDDD